MTHEKCLDLIADGSEGEMLNSWFLYYICDVPKALPKFRLK